MLEADNLEIKVKGQVILNNISLRLEDGKNYFLFGPNGSGKTTLLKTIMGLSSSQLTSGEIEFQGKDITKISSEERAKLGIFLGFQHPPSITGVKLSDLLKLSLKKDPEDDFSREEMSLIESFRLTDFLDRDINVGFSGGEKKRAEALQILFLQPKLLLLDEPDSGVDVDSLRLIGEALQKYIDKNSSSAMIVTHHGEILEHMRADHACVMFDKEVRCYANPENILDTIKEEGYTACRECDDRITEGW